MLNKDYLRNLPEDQQKKLRSRIITTAVASAILTLGLYEGCRKDNAQKPPAKTEQHRHAPQKTLENKVEGSREFRQDVNNQTYSLSQSIDSVMARIRKFKPTFEKATKILDKVYGLGLSWMDYASLPGAETKFAVYPLNSPDKGYAQMRKEHYEGFVRPDIQHSRALRSLFGGKVPTYQEIVSNPHFNVTASAISLAKLSRFFKHQHYDINLPPKDAAVAAYNAGPGRIHLALSKADDLAEAVKNIQDAKRVDIGKRDNVPTAYEDMYRAKAFANALRIKFRQNKPDSSSISAQRNQASLYSLRR